MRRDRHGAQDTRMRLARYAGSVPYYGGSHDQPSQERALGRGRDALVVEGVPVRLVDRRVRRYERAGHAVAVRTHGATADVFVAPNRADARRLAAAFADPARGAREAGRLLGYPRCCVEAFATSPFPGGDDWSHFLRGLRATRRRPSWMLNALANLALVPFHPCRLDCPAASAFARGILRAQPLQSRPALRARLSAPTLRWSDRDVVLFDGAWTRGFVRYRRFAWNAGAPDVALRRRLVRALSAGDSVSVEGATVSIRGRGRDVFEASLAPRRPLLVRWW